MQKITPFLMFNDRAVEALEFYTKVFPNSKILATIPGPDGNVMGGSIEIDGTQVNMYNGGAPFTFTMGISLMVNTDDQEETDRLYEGLSEGGKQLPCGWLEDKFGVSWQITPKILMKLISDPDAKKAKRATEAMMKMHKIIIADLETAAAG
jgi:predicted 3-demethylubiquinone-9 3-methyltransferase (glyoxalase superfamily)